MENSRKQSSDEIRLDFIFDRSIVRATNTSNRKEEREKGNTEIESK